jgi:hypothetical protein
MQSSSSPFLVNIVPLQNVVANSSGVDDVTTLKSQVANIQAMVNYDSKTLKGDILSAFTNGNPIQVVSPLNLSNVSLFQNGSDVSSGGSGSGSNLVNGETSIQLFNTTDMQSPAITFNVGGLQAGAFMGDGMFTVAGSGLFNANCIAQQFVTLSDQTVKDKIQKVEESVLPKFQGLGLYSYEYKNQKEPHPTIGLLAQEVEKEFPLCVKEIDGKKFIAYDGIVALLVKAVQELSKQNS